MKVLVTAGPVYGPLDDNKLVSNRARGLWALRFARHLTEREHDVTVLVSDILPDVEDMVKDTTYNRLPTILRHRGFEGYRAECQRLAPEVDAAVMAAAVVNWIPAEPVRGKMSTKGYKPGDRIDIPFVLAPRVIEDMKRLNPRLTLIGCKLLSGATREELIEAAYSGVLLPSRCNVVVANDLQAGLRGKYLVYPDRTVQTFRDEFGGLYAALTAAINDRHYRTSLTEVSHDVAASDSLFDEIVEKYRGRFVHRAAGSDRVFGAIYTPTGDIALGICSPREKGEAFTAKDAVVIESIEGHTVHVVGRSKATLNAPLLVRVAQKYPMACAVLHLHEQLAGVPTVPYAPPGTVRDGERIIPGPAFNIEGHGFIACLDANLEVTKCPT